MTRDERLEYLAALEELETRHRRNKFVTLFPDKGPFRRELYQKHLKFFKDGARYNERALLGGNRSGKTLGGSYEMTCHLTGLYPQWWEGKRFEHPVDAWAAGDTAKTVRDIIQATLLGPPGVPADLGTGMIPGDLIVGNPTPKQGTPDAYETVRVRHISGGTSVLQFKSYDQGRDSFQGTSQHVIWPDEECPLDIWAEMVLRTMTVDGIVYLTATPLQGLTPLMLEFLPEWKPLSEDDMPGEGAE
jgi:phage terminase large subunit-like protein